MHNLKGSFSSWLRTVFVASFALIAVSTASASPIVINTLDQLLSQIFQRISGQHEELDIGRYLEWQYKIPVGYDAVAVLEKFIQLKMSEVNSVSVDRDFAWLAIGDAYHWIGHYQEEMGLTKEAEVAFQKAIDGYSHSAYVYSPFVAGLNGLKHSQYHLLRLQKGEPTDTVARRLNVRKENQMPFDFEEYQSRIATSIRQGVRRTKPNACASNF